jgi:hypothetical protein
MPVRMTFAVPVLFAALAPLSAAKPGTPQPIRDVTVSWYPRWPTIDKQTACFYFNRRFVGFDEDGLRAVIDAMRKLPAATSVVWFTDPKKELSGPGGPSLPRGRFPRLWDEFLAVAKERNLPLSSLGYAPQDDYDGTPSHDEYLERAAPVKADDIILTWKSARGFDEQPNYAIDGQESGRGPGGFLATMKELEHRADGSRVRLRSTGDHRELPGKGLFLREFDDLIASKRFRVVFEWPKKDWPAWANRPACCRFEWRNFESAETPHEEVLYLVDGKVAGMGDAGFTAVLERLAALPAGAYVEYPQYRIHGMAMEHELREAFRAADLVPFAHRRKELSDLVQANRLVTGRTFVLYWPKPTYDNRVDRGAQQQWYLSSLLRFATIVRDGNQPAEADLVVTWMKKAAEDRTNLPAEYLCNAEKVGSGTPGVLAVLKRLESLPDGATVRIDPICIRTHGPFRRAIVMQGQRHFETTGEEPFRGLIDLFAEPVQRKRLRVDLLPDEGKRQR